MKKKFQKIIPLALFFSMVLFGSGVTYAACTLLDDGKDADGRCFIVEGDWECLETAISGNHCKTPEGESD